MHFLQKKHSKSVIILECVQHYKEALRTLSIKLKTQIYLPK